MTHGTSGFHMQPLKRVMSTVALHVALTLSTMLDTWCNVYCALHVALTQNTMLDTW